ncbi:MAG: membrane dipeptidase [Anaerolineales bacterium]|nr:membrane dipeptidase [Anaerolineales bacterium]
MLESLDSHVERLLAPGVIDMHFDLLLDLYDQRERAGVLASDFLPDMRRGGMGVIAAAIYLEDKYLPEMGLRVALDQVARLYEEVDGTPDCAICRSYDEITAARQVGKIAFLITMEGAEPLGVDLNLLRVFYELGLRALGLTHARRNLAGDGGVFAALGSSPAGISAFGKRLIQECDRLGIIVDLAHLNPAGVDDVLSLVKRPPILSHTNPRRFYDMERNSSDAQIREVGRRGGVIGVNAVLLSPIPGRATLDHYVDHIEAVADIAGIDAVACGFDFVEFLFRRWSAAEQAAMTALTTAVNFPPDLSNHSHARNLVRRLIERGFSDDEITKIMHLNWMRVFRQWLD